MISILQTELKTCADSLQAKWDMIVLLKLKTAEENGFFSKFSNR